MHAGVLCDILSLFHPNRTAVRFSNAGQLLSSIRPSPLARSHRIALRAIDAYGLSKQTVSICRVSLAANSRSFALTNFTKVKSDVRIRITNSIKAFISFQDSFYFIYCDHLRILPGTTCLFQSALSAFDRPSGLFLLANSQIAPIRTAVRFSNAARLARG